MIKITSTNDVIIVEGDELTRHYPYNGTLVIPKNSTLVLLDESSEMVLFKSASNYDTLFTGILGSIYIEDEIVTRDNIIEKFNAISNVIQGVGNVDLFEVVQSLPTENISDNKVYLVLDSNGSEGNTYVEYLYVNGQWEELGKFKVNIDLSGYATEQWVNSQGFLKEHQDISNLATKSELNTKQDTISDLETIRSGAALGATALQSVPSEYAKKTDILSAKTDTRYTDYDVQNPVLSGKTILLQNEVTDSRKYHTLGYDKTTTVIINGLLNYSTPLYRDSNEYNCPQWDGHSIRFTYQEGTEVYTTLKIPYTYNGIKYVTHLCINVYNESVRMMAYPYTDDGNFPDYQIVPFKDSEIYNSHRSYGTLCIYVNGEMQNYDSEPYSPDNFSTYVGPGDTVEIKVFNFPLTTPNGALIIETPRFYLSSNNVLTGDVPTEEDTSNAPERLNDYIRYANNVKAYILTDKNTTFKTINGQQITGNGDITIDTNVDLTRYATKEELNAKQDVISDLDSIRSGAAKGATALQSVPSEYATEQWVNSQGFLKEHQDISNLATKQELATKQDVISDLQTIRSGAALGATALQSVPSEYATEQWVNEQGFLKEHQDISNLATKSELNAKQDTLVSGTNIKTINGTSLLGSGNIVIEASAENVPTLQTTPKGTTNNYIYSTGIFDGYGVISDITNSIIYSTDKASIATWKRYWGEESSNSYQSWSIKGATTSEAGLMSASDKSKLDGIDLSTKQDKLVSGTNIKTINGTSLLGSGDITIEGGSGNVDLTDYYTKTETNALVSPKLSQVTLTQAEYDALQTKENNVLYIISDASTTDSSDYYTKAEIDSMIGGVSSTITEINNLVV